MSKRIVIALISLTVLLLLLCGCADHLTSQEHFDAGSTITPEQLKLIERSMAENETEPLIVDDGTVYFWTASGGKVHLHAECQSLSRSDPDNIVSGNLEAAIEAGKDGYCSNCLKFFGLDEGSLPQLSVAENTTTTSVVTTTGNTYETETTTEPVVTTAFVFDQDTVCYWTKTGSKVHLYGDCSSLSRTAPENLFHGNIDKAIAENAKKDGYCSYCLKKAGLDESALPPLTGSE